MSFRFSISFAKWVRSGASFIGVYCFWPLTAMTPQDFAMLINCETMLLHFLMSPPASSHCSPEPPVKTKARLCCEVPSTAS